jgi:hypothetical protein
MSCPHFPCALDAPCAPWNDGLPLRVRRFALMRRYVRWWLEMTGQTAVRHSPVAREPVRLTSPAAMR